MHSKRKVLCGLLITFGVATGTIINAGVAAAAPAERERVVSEEGAGLPCSNGQGHDKGKSGENGKADGGTDDTSSDSCSVTTDPVEEPAPEEPVEPVVTTPVEGTTPVEDTTPVEETTPVEDTTPVEETTPVEDTTPVEETTPVEDTTPVEETTPVEDTTPVEETTPVVPPVAPEQVGEVEDVDDVPATPGDVNGVEIGTPLAIVREVPAPAQPSVLETVLTPEVVAAPAPVAAPAVTVEQPARRLPTLAVVAPVAGTRVAAPVTAPPASEVMGVSYSRLAHTGSSSLQLLVLAVGLVLVGGAMVRGSRQAV